MSTHTGVPTPTVPLRTRSANSALARSLTTIFSRHRLRDIPQQFAHSGSMTWYSSSIPILNEGWYIRLSLLEPRINDKGRHN